MNKNDVIVGVLGGSGLYHLENLRVIEELDIHTPFGAPSDKIVIAESSNGKIAFLPRHGRSHSISPSEINFRANIYALKSLGVKKLISISAVGSLKEEIAPGHFVIPDQLFDRTKTRISTFFGNGIVGHVPFADPYCNSLSNLILSHSKKLKNKTHFGGTYVCIEGPQFSTKAESHFYRSTGASIIGMTNLHEAKLAREAELCFSTIALVTDYDVWKEEEVTVEMVINTMKTNSINAKKLLNYIFEDKELFELVDHSCYHSLDNAIMTDAKAFPKHTYKNLELLIGKRYGN